MNNSIAMKHDYSNSHLLGKNYQFLYILYIWELLIWYLIKFIYSFFLS